MLMVNIQDGSLFKEGYGIVAKKVMKDKELSIQAKGIYSFLCTYASEKHDNKALPRKRYRNT